MSRLAVGAGRFVRLLAGALMLITAPLAGALEVTLTAQYRGGGSGEFENTTPPAGFCRIWSALCQGGRTASLPITYVKRSINIAPDHRDQYYFKLPARREIDVYHELTGEPRRMVFEFLSVSQSARLDTGYNPLNGTFQGGCAGTSKSGNASHYTFHTSISNPQSPEPCWMSYSWAADDHQENTTVLETGAAYSLNIPPPYRLKAGIYRGSVTYTIGPGGDFDFGNNVTALSGDTLTVNFELDVQHAFIFEFPPGSERAVLEPKGGWQAWLGGGNAPQRLYRDLPFRLWSTGPFKVYKLCEQDVGDRCGIRNDSGHQVPVQVALSLPPGIRYRGGTIEHLALPSGRLAALQFEAAMPSLNRPGQLHFEVGRDDVRGMLAHAGSTYRGQVTVVFDAEL